MSQIFFTALILVVGVERLVELRIARRNLRWSLERGGQEFAPGHYRYMVTLHTGFLIGALAEVWLLGRFFHPVIGIPMLMLLALAQSLRWWVIKTLGPMWNTRIVVVSGLRRIERGPFKYTKHPNYVAVALEGIALPLVHSAWITAVTFTFLNALLMTVRISEEDKALGLLRGGS